MVALGSMLVLALSAAAGEGRFPGFVSVADHVPADGKTDVSDALQKLIDSNPNRTLWFSDGTYLLSKPICTPARPESSVDLRLSNYAIIKAAPDWSSSEAMVRLGAIHPANDIRTPGSNYSFTGGIIDGSGVAKGISIDGGRETKVRDVSMKRVLVGLHIKPGANSGSSDCDIGDVNIVGNRATNSIGVLVEGHDNTLSNMRIADVYVGVRLLGAGNSLRNIHPLFTCGYDAYEQSIGFDDRNWNTWMDFCYSDHFSVGFNLAPNTSGVYHKCFTMWYAANPRRRHTAIRAEGEFRTIFRDFTIGFKNDEAVNAVLEVGQAGGKGRIDNLRANAAWVNSPSDVHRQYLMEL
ncbi:MAG: glycosyl hydrolase family 28-related protein, partial [Kiritimatiellia bacterium]